LLSANTGARLAAFRHARGRQHALGLV